MQPATLNPDTWTLLGTGLTVCVIQSQGDVIIHQAASAPADTDYTGWQVESGEPVDLPQVAALGGGVWAKAEGQSAGIVYATASA